MEGQGPAAGVQSPTTPLTWRTSPAEINRGDSLAPVACLWTRTEIPGADGLWSFAAITAEPPPEVAAAGHDRCV